MISAPGEPPGSRVSWARMPNERSRAASIAAWVDLPVPSPPSNVMKRPRISPLLSRLRLCRAIRAGAGRDLYPFGGGAKQVDHKFRRGIEGALRDRARGDAFGRLHRHLEHLGVAAPDLQIADRLPLAAPAPGPDRCRPSWR